MYQKCSVSSLLRCSFVRMWLRLLFKYKTDVWNCQHSSVMRVRKERVPHVLVKVRFYSAPTVNLLKPIRLLIPHTLTDPNQHKPLLSPSPRSSSHYTPWLCSIAIPETLLSNPMSINTYHEDCSLVSGAGQPTRHFNSEDGCPISEGTIRKASKGLSPQGSDGFCYFSSSLTDVSVK